MTQVLGSGKSLRQIAVQFLLGQIPDDCRHEIEEFLAIERNETVVEKMGLPKPRIEGETYKIGKFIVTLLALTYEGPFSISVGPLPVVNPETFTMEAPTTSLNLIKLLRGIQIPKPILMEGSPGVGKTTLVCFGSHSSLRF